MNKEAKFDQLKHLSVIYPEFIEGLDLLKVCYNSGRYSEHLNMFLTGPRAVGKTFLLREFQSFMNLRAGKDAGIVYISLLPGQTVDELVNTLLIKINEIELTNGDIYSKFERLRTEFTRRKKLIILDHIDIAVEQRQPVQGNRDIPAILDMIMSLGIPVVLVGSRKVETVLYAFNKRLQRRISMRYELQPFKLDIRFTKHLQAIEAQLPFELESGLGNFEKAELIYSYSEGYVGRTLQLINFVAHEAIDSGASRLSTEAIELALKLFTPRPYGLRPYKDVMKKLQPISNYEN